MQTIVHAPPRISIVIPVRDERENLEPVCSELAAVLANQNYEIIIVDDASTDGSLAELERLRAAGLPLRVVSLPYESGQSAAVCAGLDAAEGEIVVTMDGDGQIDPAPVPAMLLRLESGACDAVIGVRAQRASGMRRRWQSAIANGVRDAITGDRVSDSACSLRVARLSTWQRLPRFDGMHRFFPTLARHTGARVEAINITERARRHGQSHYGAVRRAVIGLRDAFRVRRILRRPPSLNVPQSHVER